MFIKGRGLFSGLIIRYSADLVAQEPAIPAFNVFKSGVDETAPERTKRSD
jgi:hypothetical protein